MKVTEHVEHLLRQGRRPKELLELGFPKQIVTKVRRRLREEKKAAEVKTQKPKTETETSTELAVTSPAETAPFETRLKTPESKIRELEDQLKNLEELLSEFTDMKTRLDGTPALGLRRRFTCDCGASGYVALHIQCTKCGKETWWGWFPKE